MCGCKCNKKGWILSALTVAVAYFLMDMFFHHKCLGGLYQANLNLFRPMEESKTLMPYMYVGYLLFGLLFSCIYTKGYEASKAGWQQGLRYGFWLGLLYWGARLLLEYPFCPMPDALFKGWFLIGMTEFVVLGLLTGLIYKDASATV